MPKYYSAASGGLIVDYPEEAAALFDDLKPVPSEKHKDDAEVSDTELMVALEPETSEETTAKASAKETSKKDVTNAK